MKILSCLLFFFLAPIPLLIAQLLIPMSTGDVVNTPSDSRSVNLVDLNGDGWDDIFISNGPSGGAANFMYLNNGNGTFSTATGDAIVTLSAPFDGATFGDVDNDGDLDAFLTTWYGNRNYYLGNNSTQGFILQNSYGGITGTYSETAAWGDYNLDGILDLYVTNSDGDKSNLMFKSVLPGWIFDVTTGDPATDEKTSRGANWVDVNGDGHPDLFVANELNESNDLYINNGDETFTKDTNLPSAMNGKSSMSGSWGDVDNDGDLDLVVANALYFSQQDNQLFLNDGNGGLTLSTAGDLGSDGGCSYSSSFADYDNDGDLDLFIGNGFCSGSIRNFLYQNDGNGVFTRDMTSAGSLFTPCTFGAAWADLDQNGFVDLVVSTCKNSTNSSLPDNKVYMNNGNGNHWVNVNLEGTLSNRSAVGARVYVTATINGQVVRQVREISTQHGYCSQNSFTAHFGIGDATVVDEIEVEWPLGDPSLLNNIPADTTLEIVESTVISTQEAEDARGLSVQVIRDSGSGTFMVDVKNSQQGMLDKLEVFDAAGRICFSHDLGHRKAVFSTSLPVLPAGIYILRLSGEVQAVEKFLAP